MTLINYVCLLPIVFVVSTCVQRGTEELFAPRIIKGKNAPVGEFPFMVALMYKGWFRCGASILNAEWILTAAHCVYRLNVNLFSVYVGTTVISRTSGTEKGFTKIIIHEDYIHGSDYPNDIAVMKDPLLELLNGARLVTDNGEYSLYKAVFWEVSTLFSKDMKKLKTPLHLNSSVAPVALPYPTYIIEDSTPITIMGWGDIEYKKNTTIYLQEVELYVISHDECAIAYYKHPMLKKRILPSHFCAGWPKGGVGQCTGDSGGPAVVGECGHYTQLGIISFSAKPCGAKGYPGIFTNLPHFRHWITSKTGI